MLTIGKTAGKRMLSYALIAALIFTLIPWSKAEANCGPTGEATYFTFNDFSTCQTAPTQVNTETINIAGSFFNVSNNFTYRVEQLVGGTIPEAITGAAQPIISSNSYLFTNVRLFGGLNRITLTGVNQAGNVVEASAFVYYGNVPLITEARLADGRLLTETTPAVVNVNSPTILVRANNTTEVTVNGQLTFSGGGNTFVASDLNLQAGRNKLTFVARNADKTYAIERDLIYFAGYPTAYDVRISSAVPARTSSLDGDPVIEPISGTVTGKILFPRPAAGNIPDDPGISIVIEGENPVDATVGNPVVFENYVEFTFTSDAAIDLTANGIYNMRILSQYVTPNGVSANFRVPFTVRDSNAPFLTGVRQLYDVTEPAVAGDEATYSSSTSFSTGQSVFQLPLYLLLETTNFSTSTPGHATQLRARINGVEVAPANFEYTAYRDNENRRIYKINRMPQGDVQLEFTVNSNTSTDSIVRQISFLPAPAVQVDNLANGRVFATANEFSTISGRLVNFNLPADASSVRFTMNGVTRVFDTARAGGPADVINNTNGDFVFQAAAAGLNLVAGPNQLTITATANGVPISTRLTVYLFSTAEPRITGLLPVPDVAIAPALDNDAVIQRRFGDPEQKFRDTGTNEYTTSEKKAEVIFYAENIDLLEVRLDGEMYATASVNNGIFSIPANDQYRSSSKLFRDTIRQEGGGALPIYDLRLYDLTLPTTGPTTVTITAYKNGVAATTSITIIREQSPFVILSPKLPNERVINQNFLPVSIQAEGADRIEIGREQMVKGTEDIFRYELKNLRTGVNNIRFTVYRGTQRLDGNFSVTYAGASTVGAQFKTELQSSGRLRVFNNELTLTFPRNTFLRNANLFPGQDVTSVDLFDKQEVLFGIADRQDGRTIKYYNAVGEVETAGGVQRPRDGQLVTVNPSELASFFLAPRAHFGYASNLYWIDAGYTRGSNQTETGYEFVQGTHPYARSNEFYVRNQQQWLEPSQRGQITIKYDSGLRNVAARNLGIWRYHNGEWTNLGGVVNIGQQTVTAPFDGFGYYAVKMIAYSFNDIIQHEYARLSLETMLARGIMRERNNNEFGVYENITRGEFAQMLVKMIGIPLEYNPNNMTFDDVLPLVIPGALWDYRYVETAVRKGIVRGKGPRIFLPNEPLTREEGAVMIARATNLLRGNENQVRDLDALQKLFTDANLVDAYAVSSILAISKAGYIQGLPNTTVQSNRPTFRFDPKANLRRADAAIIAERVMTRLKLL